MSRLESLAHIAANLGTLVAILALVFTFNESRRDAKADSIRKWQKVAVFSVLENGPQEGMPFAAIRAAYLDAVQTFAAFDVPKEEIGDAALQRILLELISDGAVGYVRSNKYKVLVVPIHEKHVEEMNRMHEVGTEIMHMMATDSCRFTVDQVRLKLADHFTFSTGEFQSLIGFMTSDGSIHINKDGRLCFGSPRPIR